MINLIEVLNKVKPMRAILDQIIAIIQEDRLNIAAAGFDVNETVSNVETGLGIVEITKEATLIIHMGEKKLSVNKAPLSQPGRYHFISALNQCIFDNKYDFIALISGEQPSFQNQLTIEAVAAMPLKQPLKDFYIKRINTLCPQPQIRDNQLLRKLDTKKYALPQGSLLNLLYDFFTSQAHQSLTITRSNDEHTTFKVEGENPFEFRVNFNENIFQHPFYPNENAIFTRFLRHIQTKKNASFKFDRQTQQFYTKDDQLLALNDQNEIIEFDQVVDEATSLHYDAANSIAPFSLTKENIRIMGIDHFIKTQLLPSAMEHESPFEHIKAMITKNALTESMTLSDALLKKIYDYRMFDALISQTHDEYTTVASLVSSTPMKFSLNELATIAAFDQYIVQQSRKDNNYLYLVFPAILVMTTLLTFHGLVSLNAFMTTLTVVAALATLALQIAIIKLDNAKYQSTLKQSNLYGILTNPWIMYNGLCIGLAVIAYLALMSNPFVAMVTSISIMSLAPALVSGIQYLKSDIIRQLSHDQNQKGNAYVLPHLILPFTLALTSILAGSGVMPLAVFSNVLIAITVISALALQYSLYQSKGDMLWHNLTVIVFAAMAYVAFMSNPLAALSALAAVITTAPIASIAYERTTNISF